MITHKKTTSMTTLNHNVFTWRNALVAAGIVGAIVLLLILFRGCDHSPDHSQDVKEVKQDQGALKTKDEQARIVTNNWKEKADSLQRINVALQAQLDVYKQEAAKSKEKAGRLVKELDRAKAERDTSAYVQTCDTLQQMVQDQAVTIDEYILLVDSVSANYQQQIDYKDSIINQQVDLLAAFRESNTKLEQRYYEINTDYLKATKKLKRERTLGRVLAGAVLVLGGLLLSK